MCECRIEDGHLVPCPEAERLFGDIKDCDELEYSFGELVGAIWDEDRLAVARQLYEDHVVQAAIRIDRGRALDRAGLLINDMLAAYRQQHPQSS